jgi:hypothetical protein
VVGHAPHDNGKLVDTEGRNLPILVKKSPGAADFGLKRVFCAPDGFAEDASFCFPRAISPRPPSSLSSATNLTSTLLSNACATRINIPIARLRCSFSIAEIFGALISFLRLRPYSNSSGHFPGGVKNCKNAQLVLFYPVRDQERRARNDQLACTSHPPLPARRGVTGK